jgi:hypothetical protein
LEVRRPGTVSLLTYHDGLRRDTEVQCSIRFSVPLMEVVKTALTFSSAFTPSPEQPQKPACWCREFLIQRTVCGFAWNAVSRSAVKDVGALPCLQALAGGLSSEPVQLTTNC